MEIPPDFLEEMDQEDPFGELFSIVGMAASPKALVLPALRWRADIAMAPAGGRGRMNEGLCLGPVGGGGVAMHEAMARGSPGFRGTRRGATR